MSKFQFAQPNMVDSPQQVTVTKETAVKARVLLRLFRYLLICLLVLLLTIITIVNRDSINMDNLRRLFAKIDIGISMRGDVDGKIIELNFDEDTAVASFKDGLAYLSPSELTIIDNLGTVFMSTDTGFSNPQLLTDSRYTVAYDLGGHRVLTTNSFTVLSDIKFEEKITGVTLGDNHYLSVLTTGGGYKSTLYVYNNSFEEVFVWHSNERYLLNAAVSPDKKTVALIGYNTKNQNKAELVGIQVDKEKIAWSQTLDGLPLDICYKGNDSIALLYSDRAEFRDGEGAEKHSYSFEQNFLQSYSFNSDHTVIFLSGGRYGESTLYDISDKGEVISSYAVERRVKALDIKDDRVALLTDEGAEIYSLDAKKIIYNRETDSSVQTLCFGGKNCLLDIYNTHGVYNEIE